MTLYRNLASRKQIFLMALHPHCLIHMMPILLFYFLQLVSSALTTLFSLQERPFSLRRDPTAMPPSIPRAVKVDNRGMGRNCANQSEEVS